MKTPGYVQAVGYLDQTQIGLQASDEGGEEDPHGADQRGNPLGSLLFSTQFANNGTSNFTQVTEWSYFVGSGTFCFKVSSQYSSVSSASDVYCNRHATQMDQTQRNCASMSTM